MVKKAANEKVASKKPKKTPNPAYNPKSETGRKEAVIKEKKPPIVVAALKKMGTEPNQVCFYDSMPSNCWRKSIAIHEVNPIGRYQSNHHYGDNCRNHGHWSV